MIEAYNELSYYFSAGSRFSFLLIVFVTLIYNGLSQIFNFYHEPKYTLAAFVSTYSLGLLWGRFKVAAYEYEPWREHWWDIPGALKWYILGLTVSFIAYLALRLVLYRRL